MSGANVFGPLPRAEQCIVYGMWILNRVEDDEVAVEVGRMAAKNDEAPSYPTRIGYLGERSECLSLDVRSRTCYIGLLIALVSPLLGASPYGSPKSAIEALRAPQVTARGKLAFGSNNFPLKSVTSCSAQRC